ncbi:MAG: HAMP domain-containing protein [Arcobacteraceae bacterium]|nr:HAMP domain-containing protein [Arcobacteraceae bacterium]
MTKLPFYKRIVFKVFIAVTVVLGLSFSISYAVTIKYTNNIINKNISREFTNALNVTENFIKFIGQTTKIWAKHAIIDNDLKEKMIKKDYKNLDKLLKIEKIAMSADSIILLNHNGKIISQLGSNYQVGDSLGLQDIVKQTFISKIPLTKITRERESFIIYSSSLIQRNNKNIGMVLIGYFINDTFLRNIKVNNNIEIAFVGNSAIMSSTKWGSNKELGNLPMKYLRYQSLLKDPNNYQKISYLGNDFIVSARKLKNIDSSISGSILIGHYTKDIDFIKNSILYETFIIFSSIFIISLLILFYLSKKVIKSINVLKNSTLKIASGDLSGRVNINTNDELEILAQNFNKMVDSVELKNKQLEDYTIHLEDEVEKRTQELIKKEKALFQQSKMASMGEMLENIAHQWRQPLSVISTAATGMKLQKEFGVSNEKDEIKSLTSINNSAQYLSKTIDDFRDFFKSDKKKIIFNLKNIYNNSFNILDSKFKNKDIEIIQNLQDVNVFGFDGEMSQVIINLLNNASDVLLNNKKEKMYIFVNIYKDKNNAVLEIKDSGGGVPKDIIDKVFEPYFTTKHKAQGTGIGLYMCKEMITKHMKGTIKVENIEYKYNNENHKGACFKIKLPLT